MMRPPGSVEKKTELEIKKDAREEYASRHIRECYDEAACLREKHGVPMLSMTARRSDSVCEVCYQDFVPRGTSPADPLLRHEHFTLEDINRDPALELAIADAKRSFRHPLERQCRPRNKEELAAMTERIRALFPKEDKPLERKRGEW